MEPCNKTGPSNIQVGLQLAIELALCTIFSLTLGALLTIGACLWGMRLGARASRAYQANNSEGWRLLGKGQSMIIGAALGLALGSIIVSLLP